MRILVLGGDGFCGWPTALHLSDLGHDVTIVDNLSRRAIDLELEVESLTPIRPISERLRAWREVSGTRSASSASTSPTSTTGWSRCCSNSARTRSCTSPSSAPRPYSMRSQTAKRYTVDNNVRATHNLLAALVDHRRGRGARAPGHDGRLRLRLVRFRPDPRGLPDRQGATPDGELEREILHPANPGSVYHLTKTLDQLMFAFYAKNDRLRITDLHQGIVWGTQTRRPSGTSG
jgi:UDP-sulfoquinovose synthase